LIEWLIKGRVLCLETLVLSRNLEIAESFEALEPLRK
jgi:hypothetical protein